MSQEKMERMYDAIINCGSVITERTFLINGIAKPKKEIAIFLQNGTLEETEPGKYKLTSVHKLYEYGIKLLSQGHVLRANLCFERCYNTDNTHRDSCLQALLLALKNKKYLNAYEILEKIMVIEPDNYKYDNNLFLYLLTIIADDCPDKYPEITKKFKTKDVLSPAEKDVDAKLMRQEIMRGKYPHAMYLFHNMAAKSINTRATNAVFKELIAQTIHKEKEFRKLIDELIAKEAYHVLLQSLENKKSRRELSVFDKQMYIIVNAIIQVLNDRIIPTATIFDTNDFYKALKGNNFAIAAELNQKFIVYSQTTPDAEMLNKLLTVLNNLISELKEEQASVMPKEESKTPEIDAVTNVKPNMDTIIKEAEEMAYYLKEVSHISNYKTLGVMSEQILLIKLIYARDYYIEGDYVSGDALIKEVERSFNSTATVICYLNEVKANRNNYQKQTTNKVRNLTIQIPRNKQEETC